MTRLGEDVMDKAPDSLMCFVCGIGNPIGLHPHFCANDEDRCIAGFHPKPEHQGSPGSYTGD